jgi:hypothetical protein
VVSNHYAYVADRGSGLFILKYKETRPIIFEVDIHSGHRGDGYGNEHYGFAAMVQVSDLQGLDDIASVTVIAPGVKVFFYMMMEPTEMVLQGMDDTLGTIGRHLFRQR